MLSGTVVVSNQRPHALHDSACGEVQERLQLIVNAQHQCVNLRIGSQNGIQCGNQQRGQRQIQGCGNADGIELADHGALRLDVFFPKPDGNGFESVDHQINHQRKGLPQAGRQCGTLNAHFGERSDAENQQRVQNDVCNAACGEAEHGNVHAAHGLINLFKGNAQNLHNTEQKYDVRVPQPQRNHGFGIGKQPEKCGHDENAAQREHNAVHHGQSHTLGGGFVGGILVSGTQIEGNHCIDAHAESHSYRQNQILNGVNQRKGGHCVFTDFGHKITVYNII